MGTLIATFLVLSSVTWIPAYAIYFIVRKYRQRIPITWSNLTRPNWPAEHPESTKPKIDIKDNLSDELIQKY